MKKSIKSTLILFILTAFCVGTQAQTYTLEYKFEDGNTYTYSMKMENKMTQEMMGQEMTVNSELNSVVKAVSEGKDESGNYKLITSLDSAKVRTQSPMGDTTIVLNDMLDKRVQLHVSPKGKIVKREILDSIEVNMMTGQFNRESISFAELPENEVKAGETWTVDKVDTVEAPGGQFINTSKTIYTLGGTENIDGCECLSITFTTDMTVEGNSSMQGFDFVAEGSGKANGIIHFDNEKGQFNYMNTKMELQINLAGTGQQNLIIPITQSMNTTYKLKN